MTKYATSEPASGKLQLRMEPRLRLGQLLVDACIISEQQLQEVLDAQKIEHRRLGSLLVERGLINETQLTQILSQQLSVPWVSLYHVDFSKRLLSLVPFDIAEKYCVVPIYVRHVRGQGDTLYVAMEDPTNDEALKTCTMWAGLPTRPMIASPTDIRNAIKFYYGAVRGRGSNAPPSEVAPETVHEGRRAQAEADETRPRTEPVPPPGAATPDEVQEAPLGSAAQAPTPAAEPTAGPQAPAQQPPPVETPATVEEASAQTSAVPTAEAPTADAHATVPAEPSVARIEPTAEPGPQALDQGTLTGAAEQSPQPAEGSDGAQLQPEARSRDDEATVEMGEELPLEAILPRPEAPPTARAGAARLMTMTLLDGTTLALPVRRLRQRRQPAAVAEVAEPTPGQPEDAQARQPELPLAQIARHLSSRPPPGSIPPSTPQGGLFTTRHVIAALRAAAKGRSAPQMLGGPEPNWQAVCAALIRILLRKGLLTDEDFAEELRRNL